VGGFKNQIGYAIGSVVIDARAVADGMTAFWACFEAGFGKWQLRIKRLSRNIGIKQVLITVIFER